MIRSSRGTNLAALVLLIASAQPCASGQSPPGAGARRQDPRPDRTYALGRDGWVLEGFAQNIAVLRTGVTSLTNPAGPRGLLVLSCEAGERRWRLSLPEPFAPDAPAAGAATILLRAAAEGEGAGVGHVEEVETTQGRTLTRIEAPGSGSGFVRAFLRLLRGGARLDLLLRMGGAGRNPILPGPLLPVHVFSVMSRPTDAIAFDDFLARCSATPH